MNPKKNIQDIYPLSPTQEGILFHTLISPESGIYQDQILYTLIGKLDTDNFHKAWQKVIARHSILRTLYLWEKRDKPIQVVRKQVKTPLEIYDWRNLSQEIQFQKLEKFLKSDLEVGFDLTHAPLMRLTLFQTSDEKYEFLWSYHASLIDGWSLPLVIKDFIINYEALINGKEINLSPPRPYKDYITWLSKQNLPEAMHFWTENLKGLSTPTKLENIFCPGLTNDTPHNEVKEYSQHRSEFSSEFSQNIEIFARQHHISESTVLSTAWAILLSRYSGEDNTLFGITLSGRPTDLEGAEDTVGLFINTLPLRVQVDPTEKLVSLLKHVQLQQAQIQEVSYSPLIDVQLNSEIPTGKQIFESILVFSNYPKDIPFLDGINSNFKLENFRAFRKTNYLLTIMVVPGHQWSLFVDYDRQVFADHIIFEILNHLKTLLKQFISQPQAQISQLSILSQPKKDKLVYGWNQTQTDYPKDKTIPHLFEELVSKTPNNIALIEINQKITFGDLNQYANRLAHYLLKQGIRPGKVVGIGLNRSIDTVASMIAIMKIGAAYLTLDPNYPPSRLSYMINDAQITTLITNSTHTTLFKQDDLNIIALDTSKEIIATHSNTSPFKTTLSPQSAAYIIYTSGSTGQPKGVIGTHQGAVNRFHWMWQTYPFDADEVACHKTSINFVDSIWEIFGPLLQGIPAVIIPDDIVSDVRSFIDTLSKNKITRIVLVPSMLNAILKYGKNLPKKLKHLKFWVTSGEALSSKLWEAFHQKLPGKTFLNLYGSSEVTADATWMDISQLSEAHQKNIPIGKPIANNQVYILDKFLDLIPDGVPGDLYISGDGLSTGYQNQPAQTAERFLPNPFSIQPGSRIYKTGDRARYLPDGSIQFLGRKDYQVKVRGARVELGEVEQALLQVPNIDQAIVINQQTSENNTRLIAYVIPNKSRPFSASDTLDILRNSLPNHMLPTALLPLDKFLLTSSGKIDRLALPTDIDTISAAVQSDSTPPQDEYEVKLSKIWENILSLSNIGIKNDFFELGGHSLLAVRLFGQIEKVFAIKLPLATLYQAPTIFQQAQLLREYNLENKLIWSPIVSVRTQGTNFPLFYISGKGGNPLSFRPLIKYIKEGYPIYLLQSLGLSGDMDPLESMEEIAAYYINHIKTISPEGPYYLLGSSFGGMVAYEMACQLTSNGDEVKMVVMFDTFSPNYPKYLPHVNRWKIQLYKWSDYVNKHITNMRIANWSQRLQYINYYRKVSIKIIIGSYKNLIRSVNRVFNLLPKELRSVEDANIRAALNYNPPTYDATVILFSATIQPRGIYPDPKLGWGDVNIHELKTIDIPGHHGSIHVEPRVGFLAEKLNQQLDLIESRSEIFTNPGKPTHIEKLSL